MKKNSVMAWVIIAGLILSGLVSCKKDQLEATVTVVVGEVKIVAADGSEKESTVGMILAGKTTIVTGKDSMALVQIGTDAVIKIQPESKLVLDEVMNPAARKLVLDEGAVLARLRKLEKDHSFSIQTETQIASVRGTTFQVKSDGSVSTVAVGEGMVEVKPVSGEAVVLNAGEHALCEADKALIKEEITETEKIELEEMQALPELTADQINQPAAMAEYSKKVENSHKASAEKIAALESDEMPKTLEEMKKRYGRLDQITLFNGRTVTGVILSRGAMFNVLVEGGLVNSFPASQVRNTGVLQ